MNPLIEYLWTTVTIEFMIKFFVVYFFVVWIGLIIWVARDISGRSSSRMFQALCVIIIIFFTPLGLLLYLLIRPRKTIYDSYSEEIEENLWILHEIVEERLSMNEICPDCEKSIRTWWSVCPYCVNKYTKKKKSKKKKK